MKSSPKQTDYPIYSEGKLSERKQLFHLSLRNRLPALRQTPISESDTDSQNDERQALKRIVVFFAVMLILTLVARGTSSAIRPVVTTQQAKAGTISQSVQSSGSITASSVLSVSLPEGIVLDNILVKEGQSVVEGQTLAALKSFAKYVQIECPDEMILCQRILSIDSKKAAKPTVQYLSNQQTDILMEQPDISTPKGRRDLAMILLLYDSAARVQELCDLRICDIRIDSLPVVHLLGKGRKSRDVPLTKPCAQVLRQYICENHLDIPERRNDQLFTNPQGKKLTRSGVSYVLAKYIHKANTAVGSFFPQITPHCLRHSKAMHLVEAGKNLIYIRDFLGHESIETTQVYAKANPEARRKALETMDTRMNTPAMPDWNDDPDLKAFLKTL